MADDLSLLFKIRGDASGAKQASAETRAAIAQLRTQTITDSRAIQQSTTTAAKGPQSLAMSLQTAQAALQGVGGPLGRISPQLDNASSLMGALSSQTLTTSGSIAAIAGPIGIAVTAIAALTTGVTVLVHQFAALVVGTAQWEGKLYDLSQQTGVSVETLSTLSAVAEDTGGSIEGVSQSLVVFQGHLDEAQDATTKMGEKFTQLGISTNNTEQAFRDALRVLAAMPETFEQTNTAAELFGKRGGKQVLAILKETKGDIDGTTEKLRALNSLVTTDVARGADQLNDQLNSTQRQFRGLTAQIVNESMPLIVRALQDLSKILRENRELFILVGQAVGLFLQGNFRILAPALDIASRAVDGHKRALLPLIEIYERLAAVMQLVTNSVPNVDPNAIPAVKGSEPFTGSTGGTPTAGAGIFRKKGTGGGGGSSAAKISEGQRLLNQLTEEYNRLQEKANELSKVKIVALEILDSKYKNLGPTLRDQIFQQAALIDQAKEQADSDKRKAEATEKIRALLNSQTEAIRQARIGEAQWTDQIVKLEAELKKLGLTMDDNTRKLLLDNAATQQALALTRERIALEQTRIDRMERDRLATPERKQEQLEREQGIFRSEGDEERQRRVTGEIDQNRSAIDQLFGAIDENLSGATQTAALAGLEALTGAFQGLGQAVGAVVEAWVLYGSAGTSVRKVTAQILAGVAQQAAVKAIFELAEGFAALALAFFGMPNAGPSASAHFTAAAIYGSIAAVAAVAGRAVAGDAFKQQASGGSGGSSRTGGGASSSASSAKPGTTDVNRNALAQPTGTLTINLGLKQGIVAEEFRRDYMLNGPTRLIIKTDGQG